MASPAVSGRVHLSTILQPFYGAAVCPSSAKSGAVQMRRWQNVGKRQPVILSVGDSTPANNGGRPRGRPFAYRCHPAHQCPTTTPAPTTATAIMAPSMCRGANTNAVSRTSATKTRAAQWRVAKASSATPTAKALTLSQPPYRAPRRPDRATCASRRPDRRPEGTGSERKPVEMNRSRQGPFQPRRSRSH